ncbi:MAG: hypothetical protein HC831_27695 [Chloroflexia bacterium]|nr:hypothetical protein [Chloroflexia bacterium]
MSILIKCSLYLIVEIYKEHISIKEFKSSEIKNNDELVKWLLNIEASDIVTYNIDKETIKALINTKISLFVGITLSDPNLIVENYLNGSLKSDFKMISQLTN